MDAAEFSFESVSKQEALERKQPRLTKLEPTFWDHLADYLSRLETSLRGEQQKNPSSRKIALLQDELRNATRKGESLWETREKKITLHALKNAGNPAAAPPENILREEQGLYQELVASFARHTPKVLRSRDAAAEDAPATPARPAPPKEPVPSPMPPKAAPAPTKASDDTVTVRALVDVPHFVGLDGKTYRLKKGDVLSLPRKMVDILAKRGQVAVVA